MQVPRFDSNTTEKDAYPSETPERSGWRAKSRNYRTRTRRGARKWGESRSILGKKRERYDVNRSALKEGKTLSKESLLAQTVV